MKDEIKLFVKFGSEKHMKRLLKGKMYFSNANRFREIEHENGAKGQGDAYEGILRLTNGKMIAKDTGDFRATVCEHIDTKIDFTYISHTPVFCITCITTNDYSVSNLGEKRILKIHDGIKNKIKSDFPKADTACVFFDCEQFLKKVETLGVCMHGRTHYFNFDMQGQEWEFVEYIGSTYGLESSRNKTILEGSIKGNVGNKKNWKITEQNLYRILFCKDKYFENEKEYRIILPKKQINESKEFSIKWGNQKKEIMPIDKFFEGIELKNK